jgi:hypothetical protein
MAAIEDEVAIVFPMTVAEAVEALSKLGQEAHLYLGDSTPVVAIKAHEGRAGGTYVTVVGEGGEP